MRIDFKEIVAPTLETTEADHDARLEKIRALIEAGKYEVDLDQLASRVVEREMMPTRKPC